MELWFWKAKAERLLASRGLLVAAVTVLMAIGGGLALWLRPEPHSDWAYYWAAGGEASRYERGGLGLWLLAVPNALGLSPLASALLLNLPAAAGMVWLTRTAEGGRWGLATLLVALYLLLLTPFAGIVQLDLIAATAIAAGFYLAMVPPLRWPRALSLGVAWAIVVASASTKPQYGLVLWC